MQVKKYKGFCHIFKTKAENNATVYIQPYLEPTYTVGLPVSLVVVSSLGFSSDVYRGKNTPISALYAEMVNYIQRTG